MVPAPTALLQVQLLATDVDVARLHSTEIPVLEYRRLPSSHVPRGVSTKAPRNIQQLASLCDAVTGNSSIMNRLQVLSSCSPYQSQSRCLMSSDSLHARSTCPLSHKGTATHLYVVLTTFMTSARISVHMVMQALHACSLCVLAGLPRKHYSGKHVQLLCSSPCFKA